MNDINITVETGKQILNDLANEKAVKLCVPYRPEHIINAPKEPLHQIKIQKRENYALKDFDDSFAAWMRKDYEHFCDPTWGNDTERERISPFREILEDMNTEKEIVCMICKKRRMLSIGEAMKEGWELPGPGMICSRCAKNTFVQTLFRMPNCNNGIAYSLASSGPIRFEIESGPEIAKLLDGEEIAE